MRGPRVGALFAGYGGLEMATAMVWPDATLAWVSEIDPSACRVLAARAPGVPNLGDITAIDWTGVEPVDILTGGSPCQDLSLAGRRAGMTPGTRSGLWAAMCRAIETLRPSLVIWENVSGARSAPSVSDVESCPGCVGDAPTDTTVRALGRVLGDLASLRFDAEWTSVRASDIGACHQRERVFVMAWPADATRDQGRLGHRDDPAPADATQLGWDPWRKPAANQAASCRPHGESRGRDRTPLNLLPTPTATPYGHQKSASPGAMVRPSLSTLARRDLLPTPMTEPSTGNGHARDLGAETRPTVFGDYSRSVSRWAATLGRSAPAPRVDDSLSARFVEWMMGLPDRWVTDVGLSESQAKAVLGRGVVPAQAAHAIRLMLARAYASLEAAA